MRRVCFVSKCVLLDLYLGYPDVAKRVAIGLPGGTVTGYGLAAAEMKRLTAAGIKLTVCIDQVSGTCIMSCKDVLSDQVLTRSPKLVPGRRDQPLFIQV